jgi:Flp pilus assembly protein TadG
MCLVVLMGFAGLAVDLGYVQYQQRQMQSATDAAAIAGAQELISKNLCPDQTDAQTAARTDSAPNGFTNGTNSVQVIVNNPPAAGSPYASDNCAVQVNITAPHPSWFASLFGFKGAVTTTATASVFSASSHAGCLYVQDGSLTGTGFDIDSPNCGVLVNGSLTTTGGTIDADDVGYVDSQDSTGTDFTGAQPTKMLPVADPCTDITGCNDLTNTPPATPAPNTGCTTLSVTGKTNYAIPAGCYSSITLTGTTAIMDAGTWNVGTISITGGGITMEPGDYGTGVVGSNAIATSGVPITLDPGLYYFTGSVSNTGGSITGTGVTIYQADGGFNATGPSDSLSACTTSCSGGAVSGVLYFQPAGNMSASAFTGSGANYNGLVYAPGADVSATGAGTGYVIYVVGTLTNTGGTFSNTPATPGPTAGPTPTGLFIKDTALVY